MMLELWMAVLAELYLSVALKSMFVVAHGEKQRAGEIAIARALSEH